MSILNRKTTVKEPIAEGNYELPLVDIKEVSNNQGGYVQLTFKKDNIDLVHTIFGSNEKQIEYTIQTLGRQVGKFGDDISLEDVLVKGFIYKVYISYNEYGRNVSFGVRETSNDTVNPETTDAF